MQMRSERGFTFALREKIKYILRFEGSTRASFEPTAESSGQVKTVILKSNCEDRSRKTRHFLHFEASFERIELEDNNVNYN